MSQAEVAARPAVALQPVEAVEITILMDNSLDVLAADAPVARRARLPKDALSRPALRAEHAMSFLVSVVITGCGHAGVINILRDVQAKTGVADIYAVAGGFHLTGALFEPIILRTVDELAALTPRVVVPTHRNGWRVVHRVAQALPEAYVFPSVGTTVCL